jgi:hypothetical protein
MDATLPSRHVSTYILIICAALGQNLWSRRGGYLEGIFWWYALFNLMCIIEDYLLKRFSGLCIKHTLIKDVIKEIAILALEICQVLDNDMLFTITNFIKG